MKEVASILQITKRTVAAHKYAVMDLLQLKTNADLVQYAIKHESFPSSFLLLLHCNNWPIGKLRKCAQRG
jgi:hypothetical protein